MVKTQCLGKPFMQIRRQILGCGDRRRLLPFLLSNIIQIASPTCEALDDLISHLALWPQLTLGSLPHCKAAEHGRSFESLYLQFALPEKLFLLIYVSFRSPFQDQNFKRASSDLLAGVPCTSSSHFDTALFYSVCNYYDLKLPIDGLIVIHLSRWPGSPLWPLLSSSASVCLLPRTQ